MVRLILLYIPFWLNLYWNKLYRCIESCRLYIPFWLNLYPDGGKERVSSEDALHSILVKSIRYRYSGSYNLHQLYIPFWLNLYSDPALASAKSKTLHSILVKSIPGNS